MLHAAQQGKSAGQRIRGASEDTESSNAGEMWLLTTIKVESMLADVGQRHLSADDVTPTMIDCNTALC